MWLAIVERLAYGIILLIAVVVLNFLLINLAPGDIVDTLLTEAGGGDPELAARVRAAYGLDQPVYMQLFTYVAKMLTGDLGYSYYYDEPVMSLLLERLPATLLLTLSAFVIAVLLGTLMGVVAALRPKGVFSHVITLFSLLGYATPVFWLGMIILLVFALHIPVFPAFGLYSVPRPEGFWAQAIDMANHLVLPVSTLAILYLASYSRLARASMLDVLGADYIRTARTKGMSETTVVYKHALKNAALPVVTVAGLQLGAIFSGAVLVETVFSLPGLGPLLYESIVRRDFPVIMGVLFGAAVTTLVANIITDIIYGLLDPRIKGIS